MKRPVYQQFAWNAQRFPRRAKNSTRGLWQSDAREKIALRVKTKVRRAAVELENL